MLVVFAVEIDHLQPFLVGQNSRRRVPVSRKLAFEESSGGIALLRRIEERIHVEGEIESPLRIAEVCCGVLLEDGQIELVSEVEVYQEIIDEPQRPTVDQFERTHSDRVNTGQVLEATDQARISEGRSIQIWELIR